MLKSPSDKPSNYHLVQAWKNMVPVGAAKGEMLLQEWKWKTKF